MPAPRKARATARQRRKAAARTGESLPDEEIEEASASPEKKSSKPPKKAGAEPEPWNKRQAAVLAVFALVVQVPFAVALAPAYGTSPFDSVILLSPPQMILASGLCAPVVSRMLKVRRMKFLEALSVGALISILASLSLTTLLPQLANQIENAPKTTTSSPHPSSSSTGSPKPTPAPTPTVRPDVGPAKTSPTPKAAANAAVCPVDQPNCGTGVAPLTTEQQNQVIVAVIILDLGAAGLAVWLYPGIYRLFWMPGRRAQQRAEREKQRKKS